MAEEFRRYREEREAQAAGVRGEERRILTQHWHIKDDFFDEETPPADIGDEIPTFNGEPWSREERERGIFWNCKGYNNFSNCCQCKNKVLDWHSDGHPVSETGKGDDPNRFFTTWENGRWVHKDLPSADITNADNIIEQTTIHFQNSPRTRRPTPSPTQSEMDQMHQRQMDYIATLPAEPLEPINRYNSQGPPPEYVTPPPVYTTPEFSPRNQPCRLNMCVNDAMPGSEFCSSCHGAKGRRRVTRRRCSKTNKKKYHKKMGKTRKKRKYHKKKGKSRKHKKKSKRHRK